VLFSVVLKIITGAAPQGLRYRRRQPSYRVFLGV